MKATTNQVKPVQIKVTWEVWAKNHNDDYVANAL